LLAERVSGVVALAHAWAMAQAVESAAGVSVPRRAEALRTFWAEFERIRSHIRTLTGIVGSTGLSVPANELAACEEALLQLGGMYAGHRYLFGLLVPGGLSTDWTDGALHEAYRRTAAVVKTVTQIYRRLTFDNSFLDRLEAIGHVEGKLAETLGMRGPVSRAAGVARDFRLWQPYGLYPEAEVSVPTESEGDGYARLRTFMGEIHEALTLMGQVLATLPEGPVRTPVAPGAGIGVGAVEAAGGSLVYWIRLDQDGTVQRCHIMPPALANWHAVPYALRHSAFQDVPIILATFGLSVAEVDR